MSGDIMPCGCLGHFDNEHLCQYPDLKAEYHATVKQGLKANWELAEQLRDARYALELHVNPKTKHVFTCDNMTDDTSTCTGACAWTRRVLAEEKA